jgi:hypothetical protein
MAEILETVMLICFGCSWPISVINNIKAHSAKNMSIGFILLILAGYVAGITAKLLTHNYSFVLIVYVLNLIIVGANVVVYFINKRQDKINDLINEQNNLKFQKECSNMNTFSDELSKYSQMNEVSTTNGVVFFGSSYFANMPVSELARDYELEEKVYNRSLYGMTISDVDSALEDCIFSLSPKKIFVNIGEEDIKSQSFNEKEFLTKYEWMLYTIHDKTDAQIYLVSIISRSPEAAKMNKLLKKLAKESGCTYVDAVSAIYYDKPDVKVFDTLKYYIRNHSISFAEAMRMAN